MPDAFDIASCYEREFCVSRGCRPVPCAIRWQCRDPRRSFQQGRNVLGRMLQIAIHRDHDLAARLVEARNSAAVCPKLRRSATLSDADRLHEGWQAIHRSGRSTHRPTGFPMAVRVQWSTAVNRFVRQNRVLFVVVSLAMTNPHTYRLPVYFDVPADNCGFHDKLGVVGLNFRFRA